ncbi:hypothetical protein GGR52DRAFT_407216 [Hypoxylon sp. FL1284]|nr:hypothetical protein GGR52DRAFT_407216 [Hypoxylon sp. FL1284]
MSLRNNPFARKNSPSPSPSSSAVGRPKSAIFSSQSTFSTRVTTPPSHARTQSQASIAAANILPLGTNGPRHHRVDSRSNGPNSTTFAPSFIKTEEVRRSLDTVRGIEGENDFSGKRYVWLKDPKAAFVKGWIVDELGGGRILVQCDDGSVSPLALRGAGLSY